MFLDAVLAIEEHINPALLHPSTIINLEDEELEVDLKITPYDDLWSLDKQEAKKESKVRKHKKFPP